MGTVELRVSGGGLKPKGLSGKAIGKIGSGDNSLRPKRGRDMRFKRHSSGHFKESSIFFVLQCHSVGVYRYKRIGE